MASIEDVSGTIVPASEQLDADELLSGPRTITVDSVTMGKVDQPINIRFAGDDGRPYRPNKTARKILVHAWGSDARQWVGRSMTLFREPTVKFGGEAVGGIRISHLSHIERDITVSLNTTRGKKGMFTIGRLVVETVEPTNDEALAELGRLETVAEKGTDALRAAWDALAEPMRAKLVSDLKRLRGIAQKAGA